MPGQPSWKMKGDTMGGVGARAESWHKYIYIYIYIDIWQRPINTGIHIQIEKTKIENHPMETDRVQGEHQHLA